MVAASTHDARIEPEHPATPAVLLFSGGLDSATVLAMAVAQGFAVHAISFDYGQRQEIEIACAKELAAQMGAASHRVVSLDFSEISGSALTDRSLEVPKFNYTSGQSTLPITYVPARNTVFLSYALALAESLDVRQIFLGVNAVDYSGYPDCRPRFVEAFEQVANFGTRAADEPERPFRIVAPLMHMGKAEIIQAGTRLGVPYGQTHSCYDPSKEGLACGLCDACGLRRQGFAMAGVADPTRYVQAS